jgi:hypothetical protein
VWSSKDNYGVLVGRRGIVRDPAPAWRHLAWTQVPVINQSVISTPKSLDPAPAWRHLAWTQVPVINQSVISTTKSLDPASAWRHLAWTQVLVINQSVISTTKRDPAPAWRHNARTHVLVINQSVISTTIALEQAPAIQHVRHLASAQVAITHIFYSTVNASLKNELHCLTLPVSLVLVRLERLVHK